MANKKIEIPSDISYYYNTKTGQFLLVNGENYLIMRSSTKVLPCSYNKNILKVSKIPLTDLRTPNNVLKPFTVLDTKSFLKPSVTLIYKKLILSGVGYKVDTAKKTKKLLELKLGCSHPIFIKAPEGVKFICPKPSLLYILGTDLNKIDNLIHAIRKYRTPDPYIGKGVIHEYEVVKLKEGKRSQ